MTRAEALKGVDSFDWPAWTDKLTALYEPVYLALVTSQANRVMQPKKAKGPFNPQDPFTKTFVKNYIATRITQIDETTRDWVRETVADAIESEDAVSLAELAIELSDRVQESRAFAPARAALIARTEIAMAWAHGSGLGYKQDGVEKVEISDGDGDEECSARDGTIVTIEDWLAEPLLHPNCVATCSPVVEDDEG